MAIGLCYFPVLVFLLAINVVSALELKWPSNPETGVQYSIQWDSGVAPVRF